MASSADHFGNIYFDPEFRFKDGAIGEKRLVVLCASPEFESMVVVVRTTSQPKYATSYGCNLDDRHQNFYMPEESRVFPKPTWIMLDYAVEYSVSQLGTDRAVYKGRFGPMAFKHLLECASQAREIEQDMRAELARLAASL